MQIAYEVFSQNRKKRHPKGPELFKIPFNFLYRFVRKLRPKQTDPGKSKAQQAKTDKLGPRSLRSLQAENSLRSPRDLATDTSSASPQESRDTPLSPAEEQQKREQITKRSVFYKLMQMSKRNKGQHKPDNPK